MTELTEKLRDGMIWISERHEFDEVNTYKIMNDAADALEAQEDRIKALTTALDRQCDNMAFVLNRVDLHAWHGRFSDDLEADRLTLSKAPSIK